MVSCGAAAGGAYRSAGPGRGPAPEASEGDGCVDPRAAALARLGLAVIPTAPTVNASQASTLLIAPLSNAYAGACDTDAVKDLPGNTITASWYGKEHHGRRTTSGEVFDEKKLTAAHSSLPLNTVVEVTNAAPPVDLSTSSIGEVIAGRQVTELPLNGRNFTQLALLAPGVTRGN